MDPLAQLLLVVGTMAAGTFVFGSLPLVVPLGRAKLRCLELVGSGLLLGAAFTIVIPEGVQTVFHAAEALHHHPAHEAAAHSPAPQPHSSAHQQPADAAPSGSSSFWRLCTDGETVIGVMLLVGFFTMFVLEQLSSRSDSSHHQHDHPPPPPLTNEPPPCPSPPLHKPGLHEAVPVPAPAAPPLGSTNPAGANGAEVSDRTPLLPVAVHQPGSHQQEEGMATRKSTQKSQSRSEHLLIPARHDHGADPLVPPSHAGKTRQHRPPSLQRHRSVVADPRQCSSQASVMIGHSHRLSILVSPDAPHSSFQSALASIVGLLIHALADGIAMGASASSNDEQLRWIVFGAILIHKAPTAFGLCSVLIARGLSRSDIFKAQALFSLCTPVGAVSVYFLLQVLFSLNDFVLSMGLLALSSAAALRQLWVGAALTFSGGTFLFVALHALEDVTDSLGPDAGIGAELPPLTLSSDEDQIEDRSSTQRRTAGEEDNGARKHYAGDASLPFDVERSGGSSSSSSSTSAGSDAHAVGIVDRGEPGFVSQSARIALVFLGSLIPKMLELMTGGHGHGH